MRVLYMSKRKRNTSPNSKTPTPPSSNPIKQPYYTDDVAELLKDVFSEYDTIFFDNDRNNFEGFDKSINILIDDSIPNENIRNYTDTEKRSWWDYSELKRNRDRIPYARKMRNTNDDNHYVNTLASNLS